MKIMSGEKQSRSLRTLLRIFSIDDWGWSGCSVKKSFSLAPSIAPMPMPTHYSKGIVTSLSERRYSNASLRMACFLAAAWFCLLHFTFFALLIGLTIAAFTNSFGININLWLLVGICFGVAVFISIYGFVNASKTCITRVTVRLPSLPDIWHGRKAVLISDLHLGNLRGASFVRKIVKKIQKLEPSVVFISGDLFDGASGNFHGLLEPWNQLAPVYGTFYVSGNREEFTGRTKFYEAAQRVGIRALDNEKVEVDGLQIIGVNDNDADDPLKLQAILKKVRIIENRASILLSHKPKNLVTAAAAGISLQLSGHTHGGQIWPWSWVTDLAYGHFNSGLNCLGSLQVFTSSGASTWGIPMRFGTRSEIVLIQFDKEDYQNQKPSTFPDTIIH